MLQTEIFSPTITTSKQYYYYVIKSCYSIYFGCDLFTYTEKMTSELCDKMASSIIQFIVYYPKNYVISFFLLYSLDFITRYFYTNCIKDS